MVLVSLVFYTSFGFDLIRTDFLKLITLFAALFLLYYKLMQFEKWNFKFLLVVGILFRLIFLFTEPNLSQDFYRFIWDGELIKNGINPYLYKPDDLINTKELIIANSQELYHGMGNLSAKHFSNYPPLNQLLFTIATFIGGNSMIGAVIFMRLTIILADIGILYFGRKLLLSLNKPTHTIFWYFLNPLIIIELTGNLHFEGVMLFFLVWSLYLLSKGKWLLAAPIYACSILLKLIPLLFLPLFLLYLGFKKSVGFYMGIGITILAFLMPFYSSEFIHNYSETVGLWFSNFEFNASIYNLIKGIAITYFDAKPWILIKNYGAIIPPLVIAFTLGMTLLKRNKKLEALIQSMLFVLTFYYFLSTTVHPWYLATLMVLMAFTNFRFAIVWSATVVLSYYAYSNPDYIENLWLLAVEYLIVFGYIGYELSKPYSIKLGKIIKK